jgi:hypothetical protein
MEETKMTTHLQSVRSDAGPEIHLRDARPAPSRRVLATQPPRTALLTHALPVVDWSDAFAVAVPASGRRDPQAWGGGRFRAPPSPVIRILFAARELVVRTVGIERGGRHVFDTIMRTQREVLLGTDQAHLGFRASVLVESHRVVLTTLVELRSRRGRAYFALVRLIHPVVVRRMLARAAHAMETSS